MTISKKTPGTFRPTPTRPRACTTTITTALTAVLLIAGLSTLSAQTSKKKALIGSWVETVWFPSESGRPPVKSVGSFHDDGIMVFSDQGGVTIEPPTVFSSFQGVWKHLEERKFSYAGLSLMSDLNGNLVGYLKVRGVYTVSQSGNEYNGTSFAEVIDVDGEVLLSVDVTNKGQRIRFEQ
jgi:hypothetical protein